MDATIEKLIQLDFDEPALQRTPIILNQANRNSVDFIFRIYKDANEIDYTQYTRAEIVFQKPKGFNVIDNGTITPSGITYRLREEIFSLTGRITGYIKLIMGDSISATLHYDFMIISDLIDVDQVGEIYVKTIEQLVDELGVTVAEARRILEDLQSDTFATERFVLDHTDPLAEKLEKIHAGATKTIVDKNGMLQINDTGQDGFLTPKLEAVSTQLTEIANPNIAFNGDFDLWQRGFEQTISGIGSADRWHYEHINTTKAVSRQMFSVEEKSEALGDPTYFSRIIVSSVTGANSFCVMGQKYENVRDTAGKTITLSFWAKSDTNRNIAIEARQNFGTGGSAIVRFHVKKIALSSMWEKYNVTIKFPSIAGKIIGVNNFYRFDFWFDSGSDYDIYTDNLGQQSGTFDIARVKLEFGDRATPFMPPDPALELLRCQRYYMSFSFNQNDRIGYIDAPQGAGNNGYLRYNLPCNMRVVPSAIKSLGELEIYDNTATWKPITSNWVFMNGNICMVSYSLQTVSFDTGKTYVVRNMPNLDAEL